MIVNILTLWSLCLYICISVCLYVLLTVLLPCFLSVCLSVGMSVLQTVRLSFCPDSQVVLLTLRLSFCLSFWLSCPFVFCSVYLSVVPKDKLKMKMCFLQKWLLAGTEWEQAGNVIRYCTLRLNSNRPPVTNSAQFQFECDAANVHVKM